MWPEGIPESGSVQDILYFQYQTIQSMYTRVAKAIERRKEKVKGSDKEGELADISPTDYLNFYCLATRETEEGGEDVDPSNSNAADLKQILQRTRRHLVYCHSKMTIVDDAIAIIGSANINQRSLDGNRDSELLLGAWQPAYLATKEGVAQGEVHAFRMHCWAHLTGVMEDSFRDPASLESVRRVNEIAKHNWGLYTQEEVCDMKSSLVPYPIQILEGGKVVARTSDGKFPDTNANILGSNPTLPEYLTT
jgi:phospholipase D1/2